MDRLIRELDQLKRENLQVEQEQIKIISMIDDTEYEVTQKSVDLANYRQEANASDKANLALRKEIEYQESKVADQKEQSQ